MTRLVIEPLQRDHIAALTEVMTRAFDDDAQRHLGVERGGPPGYDDGTFLSEHALDPRARAFTATLAERADTDGVGTMLVFHTVSGSRSGR